MCALVIINVETYLMFKLLIIHPNQPVREDGLFFFIGIDLQIHQIRILYK